MHIQCHTLPFSRAGWRYDWTVEDTRIRMPAVQKFTAEVRGTIVGELMVQRTPDHTLSLAFPETTESNNDSVAGQVALIEHVHDISRRYNFRCMQFLIPDSSRHRHRKTLKQAGCCRAASVCRMDLARPPWAARQSTLDPLNFFELSFKESSSDVAVPEHLSLTSNGTEDNPGDNFRCLPPNPTGRQAADSFRCLPPNPTGRQAAGGFHAQQMRELLDAIIADRNDLPGIPVPNGQQLQRLWSALNGRVVVHMAYVNDRKIGILVLNHCGAETGGSQSATTIEYIGVLPEYRRKCVASHLLAHATGALETDSTCVELSAYVDIENTAANRFYEHHRLPAGRICGGLDS